MRLSSPVKNFLVLAVFSVSAFGQHLDFGFDFGVKGGVPFTDVLEAAGVINSLNINLKKSDSYIIGPVGELRVPFGFAFEADALYRKAGYNFTTNDITTHPDASAWEFP